MKKILLLALFVLGSFTASNAQTCEIIGSTDGSTIEALDGYWDGDNTYVVLLSNDSNIVAANVTVTIEVIYKYGNNSFVEQHSAKTKVMPMGESLCKIYVSRKHPQKSNHFADSVKIVGVTGNKCQ